MVPLCYHFSPAMSRASPLIFRATAFSDFSLHRRRMNSAAALPKPAKAGCRASFPRHLAIRTRFSAFSFHQAANSFAADRPARTAEISRIGECDCPTLIFHTENCCRRTTSATNGQLVELAALLDHADLNTTAIYTQPSFEAMARKLEMSALNVDG